MLTLWALEDFPPYFFCDEAVSANWAEHLLQHGFRGANRELLPAFFPNGGRFNLGTSVYLLMPLVAVFGRSVVLSRAATGFVTLVTLSVLALGLRRGFGLSLWWLVPLWALVHPVWFLHSRTGFEISLSVGFFAAFLGLAVMFLSGRDGALPLCLSMAALSFYAHAAARVVVPLSVVGLFVSWWFSSPRPCIRWRWVGAVTLLWALPFARYLLNHPSEQTSQLALLGSFWSKNLPLDARFQEALASYMSAWSPRFWLASDVHPLRHVLPGMGLLQPVALVFAGLGLGVALRRTVRGSHAAGYRFLTVTLLFAPAAALVLAPGVTRQMFALPVLAALSVVGSSWIREQMAEAARTAFVATLLAFLIIGCVWLLLRAWVVGPPLDADYGYYGYQWGAPQVFREIKTLLQSAANSTVMLSPNCGNSYEEHVAFFLGQEPRLQWASFEWLTTYVRTWPPEAVFVFPYDEFQRVRASPKFAKPGLVTVLYDPSGKPAFAFFRLRYSPEASTLIAREIEERRQPVRASLILSGENVEVWHSFLDIGPVENAFDGNKSTLIRTMEANPLRLDLHFPTIRKFAQASLLIGAGKTGVRVYSQVGNAWELTGEATYPSASGNRNVVLALRPVPSQAVRVEVEDLARKGELSNVHLWELRLTEAGGHE
ncbi:hypothetical protein EG19_00030 [Thermoanaerobaculum aquaticum]|uniref:Glycosyltransferase RgtA/B/C/D-like domain-containing protein n=1 Tax=Thermoanaerobaculum aquaticum TaxID=1312852 RepID=A0A062Y2N5_9BACT|nr:hypothetical protein EG19_00030 [Thermoanaerobaculum aquaticum]